MSGATLSVSLRWRRAYTFADEHIEARERAPPLATTKQPSAVVEAPTTSIAVAARASPPQPPPPVAAPRRRASTASSSRSEGSRRPSEDSLFVVGSADLASPARERETTNGIAAAASKVRVCSRVRRSHFSPFRRARKPQSPLLPPTKSRPHRQAAARNDTALMRSSFRVVSQRKSTLRLLKNARRRRPILIRISAMFGFRASPPRCPPPPPTCL